MPEDLDFRRRVVSATGWVLAILVVLVLVWQGFQVVLLAFAGVLLAVFLRALADPVAARTRLGDRGSLLVVLLVLGLLLVGVIWTMAPSVSAQVDQLGRELPRAVARLRSFVAGSGWLQRFLPAEPAAAIANGAPEVVGQATLAISKVVGGVVGVLVILFTGIYLAVEPGLYRRGLLRLVPPAGRPRAEEVLGDLGSALRSWLLAQLLEMAVIGVLTYLGLLLLDVPLALTNALLAAALTFIPNFGPIASAIPPMLLALADDPRKALWVAALYTGVQAVESYLITPNVQRKAVHLPQALLIVWQVFVGLLAGLLGLALATPMLAAVLVLVRRLYVEDRLERPRGSPAGAAGVGIDGAGMG